MDLHTIVEGASLVGMLAVIVGHYYTQKSELKYVEAAVTRLANGLEGVIKEVRIIAVQESRIERLEKDMEEHTADLKAVQEMTIENNNQLARLSGELSPARARR